MTVSGRKNNSASEEESVRETGGVAAAGLFLDSTGTVCVERNVGISDGCAAGGAAGAFGTVRESLGLGVHDCGLLAGGADEPPTFVMVL